MNGTASFLVIMKSVIGFRVQITQNPHFALEFAAVDSCRRVACSNTLHFTSTVFVDALTQTPFTTISFRAADKAILGINDALFSPNTTRQSSMKNLKDQGLFYGKSHSLASKMKPSAKPHEITITPGPCCAPHSPA
jgi:hypothetical protein